MAPKWRFKRYYGAMATIQIKNVSDEAHAVLRQRAAAAGQSLQEYMLAWIERSASLPQSMRCSTGSATAAGAACPLVTWSGSCARSVITVDHR